MHGLAKKMKKETSTSKGPGVSLDQEYFLESMTDGLMNCNYRSGLKNEKKRKKILFLIFHLKDFIIYKYFRNIFYFLSISAKCKF